MWRSFCFFIIVATCISTYDNDDALVIYVVHLHPRSRFRAFLGYGYSSSFLLKSVVLVIDTAAIVTRLFGLGLFFPTPGCSFLPFCMLFYVFRILSFRFLLFFFFLVLFCFVLFRFYFCSLPSWAIPTLVSHVSFRILASGCIPLTRGVGDGYMAAFFFALVCQPVIHLLHALVFSVHSHPSSVSE